MLLNGTLQKQNLQKIVRVWCIVWRRYPLWVSGKGIKNEKWNS